MMLTEYTEQAMVSDWPARLFWIAVLAVCVAFTLWLVRLGWKRRAARHAHLPELDRAPIEGETLARGRYLGSAVAGNWLDRITAQGLGSTSECTVLLNADTLYFERPSGLSFRVPREHIVSVRTDKGLVGEVYGPDGIVVVQWQLGDVLLDSGFRGDPVTTNAMVLAGLSQYRVLPGKNGERA